MLPIPILIAEDNAEDRLLITEAMNENKLVNQIAFVEDGKEELMDYLNNIGKYADSKKYPLPGLILLDLNMPNKDGREALKEIKSSVHLKKIPVIIFTCSKVQEDIIKAYDLGVNSFITKPFSYTGMLNVMSSIGKYWLEIVELPK